VDPLSRLEPFAAPLQSWYNPSVNRFRRFRARLRALARIVRPREADDYLSRGLDRHLRGDLTGAMADYDRAIARYSDSVSQAVAYLTRGKARQDQGDLTGAIADYDRAIARHPGYAAAYLRRGLAYREAGDLERARADFHLVPELTSDPRWRQQAQEQLRALADEGAPAGDPMGGEGT
jgi:tetratricopeptide (TPR) repeat protein